MANDEILNEYFEWLCHFVCDDRYNKKTTYHELMSRLFEIEFEYILPMDGNRAEDGTDLRYRFGYEHDYPGALIVDALDIRPCSVLEMMVALSIRCEEHIMSDDEVGDRTGQWFWNMIVSLGLGRMTDRNFDVRYVDDVIERFMQRQYDRDGKGGLFTVEGCHKDLRSVDIWYQMCWYLDSIV